MNVIGLQPGTRTRGTVIGAGLVVFGNGEVNSEGVPLWLDDVDLARCNAAALVEASMWICEADFERMYMTVVGAIQPRYPLTVTIPTTGRLCNARWSAPGWREPVVYVDDAGVRATLARMAATLGDTAPAELEPAGGREL